MTDTTKPTRTTVKQKRQRHASAQASYMERKRAEGKEWLATWVPGPAKESLKNLAKRANEDDRAPSKSYITDVENALDATVPDWAKASQTLLNVWLVSENDVLVDFGGGKEKSKDKKHKDKDKKKKKKK
ncbi:hypothetical protein RYZ26_01965 [Terasakiella sp. A23]|uniref:hypothetical protein n=1 Tax=Terasakiella sp. FCG-A23 TaxID=3080561 RepID=UPI00295331B6|nr:hypothetical protein [Terasakiella sp. A23]MDV7338344.1 hypothetical protein [Terasakiella sp. A23]